MKMRRRALTLVLAVLLALGAAPAALAAEITLDCSSGSIPPGEAAVIHAAVPDGEGEAILWELDGDSGAVVLYPAGLSCMILGVSPGTVTVTAVCGDASASCRITVTDPAGQDGADGAGTGTAQTPSDGADAAASGEDGDAEEPQLETETETEESEQGSGEAQAAAEVTLRCTCGPEGVTFDAWTFFGEDALRNAAYLTFGGPSAGALLVDGVRPVREDDRFAPCADPDEGLLAIGGVDYAPGGYAGTARVPFSAWSGGGALLAGGTLYVSVLAEETAASEESASAGTPGASVVLFTDVSSGDWFWPYVTELSAAGVVSGYPDGTYRPQGEVTCGEALKLIMLAAGYEQIPAGETWVSGYVSRARSDGLVGLGFDADAPCTRETFVAVAAKALGLSPSSAASPFADSAGGYAVALYHCQVDGERIISGYQAGGQVFFRPSGHITRAETAKVVTLLYHAHTNGYYAV